MACLLGPLQPGLCLRSAAHRGFRKEKEEKKGLGKQGWGNGQAQEAWVGEAAGLAEFSAWRPPSGLGFDAPPPPVVKLPGPRKPPLPFLFFLEARWARERPAWCSASWGPGCDGVGAGGEGGRGRGGWPPFTGVGQKGRRRAAETCSLQGLGVLNPTWGGGKGAQLPAQRPSPDRSSSRPQCWRC